VHPGDTIIVISYGLMSDDEAKSYKPKVVIMDTNNKVIQTVHEEPHSTIF
jgi:aspartate 1-decarboxylase